MVTAKLRRGRPGRGMLLAALLCLWAWGAVVEAAAIRDIRELSQDPVAHLESHGADLPLLPPSEQARLNAEADLLYFAPWHRTEPHHPKELASSEFLKYAGSPGYGKEGRPHPKGWIGKMAANAHLEHFALRVFPAVTVKHTDFRHLPTREPHLRAPKEPSIDHPFDNLQISSVPAGMPLLVVLVSRDRKWVLAETSHLLGWVPAGDIAAADPEFIKSWENGRYAVVVRDKTPVADGKDMLFRAPLGALFPKAGEDGTRIWIWTAARDDRGRAVLRKAAVAAGTVADKPLPFTAGHVARLARELAGEPYGWGGLYGRRDCSALVRDLFAPFGLWLPRNSVDQAAAWKFTSFRNLSPAEKEALIVRQGVPWRTLLWTPGHIMLYIGVHNGKPLIFHNFWSVAAQDPDGKRDKVIVGRAAVTTLHPGAELSNRDNRGAGYLAGLAGMTLPGEPPENATAKQEARP